MLKPINHLITMFDTTWIPGGPQSGYLKFQLELSSKENKMKPRFSTALTPDFMILHRLKNEIDSMEHQGTWDEYKKITNPYEFVFLSLAKRMQYSVANKIPLSRSYYKMLEMWKIIGLDEILPISFTTAHSAEGPGGFIEACADIAKLKQKKLQFTLAMTLKSTDKNIPGWKKSQTFLQETPQVEITYGADGTGNLYNLENHKKFLQEFSQRTDQQGADLYTGDGGFDFTMDFNNQEENVLPLLLAEILLGVSVLKKGGVSIIKLFDTVMKPTLELLYLTTRLFREWTIFKPKTSREANSERYLICKGSLGPNPQIQAFLTQALASYNDQPYHSFLHSSVTSTKEYVDFEKDLMTFQDKFSDFQIKAIRKTLFVIENKSPEKLRFEIKENIQRSIEWCHIFNVQLNPMYETENLEPIITYLLNDLSDYNFNQSGPYPSRRYPRGQFQLRQTPDESSSYPFQSARVAQSYAGEFADRNQVLEEWQTAEDNRVGNWETVKQRQKGVWKGEP
jgi:hypothetical protein